MEQAQNCTDLEELFINFNVTKEQLLLDLQQFIAMAKNGTQLFLPVSVSEFLINSKYYLPILVEYKNLPPILRL